MARTLGDKGAEARIIAIYAYWRYYWLGTDEYGKLQQALNLSKESGQPTAIFLVRFLLGVFERWNGNPQRSLDLSEGMLELLQSVFNNVMVGFISFLQGMALTDIGKYHEAIKLGMQWINVLEKSSNNLFLGRCLNVLGWTHSEVYDLTTAFGFNKRSLEHAISLFKSPAMIFNASEMQAQAEVNLMENEFAMGKVDEAWEHIKIFEGLSTNHNYDVLRDRWLTRMKELKGTILLGRGDLSGAEAMAQQCLETSCKRGYKKYVGKAERLLGQVLIQRGAYDLAEARLRSALENLEQVGNPKQLWITHTALAGLYEAMKRQDMAREQWQRASAIVQSTAADLKDDQLRTTFLAAAPVREILDQAGK